MEKVMSFMGFHQRADRNNQKLVITFIAELIMLINAGSFVVYKWRDMDSRIIGVKALIFYGVFGSFPFVCVFIWDDVRVAFRAVKTPLFRFPFRVTDRRRRTAESVEENMAAISLFWAYSVIGCVIIVTVPPLLALSIKVVSVPVEDIRAEDLILSFPFYYPRGFNNLIGYLISYVIESTFFVIASCYGVFAVTFSYVSMLKIEGELKLLRTSIEEMDEHVPCYENFPGISESAEMTLKSFLNAVIQHHQFIYQKAIEVKIGIQWFAFIINTGVSLYLCMGIFCIVKRGDIILKIQEVIFCSLFAVDIFSYDLFGEKIATEDEKFRRTLHGCSWTDKPEWFKKSLLIIMARSNKPIEIKPAGLFVLNLTNFSKCANAAYTYFNVLNNFK